MADDSPALEVAVVGVGLIGGSIGLAAKRRLGARVCGYDADPAVLAEALERGAIDTASADIPAAVAGAQVVFVATPVGSLAAALDDVLAAAPDDCAVTDVGSTKRSVMAGRNDQRFVGGHPLAGAETAGVAHARADLFEGATWYLTPAPGTSGVLYERLHRTLTGLGAQPAAIEPQTHDHLMASVSHLPHVFANVLVGQAASALSEGDEGMPATGPSFRDATRVAGANTAVWTDVYRSNADALIERIDEAVRCLQGFRELLAADDGAAIQRWSEAARQDRQALLDAGAAGGSLHELRASVPNRPGIVAEIALGLGCAGINIVDMALSPSEDGSRGVVALWVRGDQDAARAQSVISDLDMAVTRA